MLSDGARCPMVYLYKNHLQTVEPLFYKSGCFLYIFRFPSVFVVIFLAVIEIFDSNLRKDSYCKSCKSLDFSLDED